MKTSLPASGATAGKFACELRKVLEGVFAETRRSGQPERAKAQLSQKGKLIRPDRAKRTKHSSSLQMLTGEVSECPDE